MSPGYGLYIFRKNHQHKSEGIHLSQKLEESWDDAMKLDEDGTRSFMKFFSWRARQAYPLVWGGRQEQNKTKQKRFEGNDEVLEESRRTIRRGSWPDYQQFWRPIWDWRPQKIEAKIHTIICIFPIVSCRSRHIHWLDWSKCQGLQDQWNKKTMGHSGADWTSTKAAEESVTGEGEWDRLKHEKDQTKLSLDSKYSGCRMNNTTEED